MHCLQSPLLQVCLLCAARICAALSCAALRTCAHPPQGAYTPSTPLSALAYSVCKRGKGPLLKSVTQKYLILQHNANLTVQYRQLTVQQCARCRRPVLPAVLHAWRRKLVAGFLVPGH
jgi:hypothetical protein